MAKPGRPPQERDPRVGAVALRKFDKELKKRLKHWALEHDCSLEQVFNRGLKEWLALQEKQA
jgi:hypothetical protein